MPLRIDDFILTHIQAIEGATILVKSETTKAEETKIKSDIIQTIDTEAKIKPSSFWKKEDKENGQQETEGKHNLQIEEERAVENWRGEGVTKPKRPRRSYLENQEEWKFIDLSENNPVIPIAILRNGNFTTLKPILVNKQKEKQKKPKKGKKNDLLLLNGIIKRIPYYLENFLT
ncbi:hypothetical protein TcasGA2_TC031784 [Tribolium castaneum]|uniref:Uncharacterized protein n=1 Tax=Tribolium castaneum TaxID=7070 RepID=A0A139WA02_TRICA|nr:hypothetical protein TcasGA2_TC031784 [Tribolium castaneum]